MRSRAAYLAFLNEVVRKPEALEGLYQMDFEFFCAHVLSSLGFDVGVTRQSPDGRAYMFSLEDGKLGFSVLVQCKIRQNGKPVGMDVIRDLDGLVARRNAAYALLVTTSTFTDEAIEFAQAPRRIQLIDQKALIRLANAARDREEEATESIAYRINRLPLERAGVVKNPDLAHPDRIILPPQFEKRILEVHGLPLTLLQRVAADPRHVRGLTPRQFEEFIAELVDGLGFRDVILTPPTYDGGKDVIASKIVDGIPLTFYFECKKYAEDNKVQLDTLRSLLGVVAHDAAKANIGVLVTTSTFTEGARELILSECRLDGKDYEGITGWIGEYSKNLVI